MTWTTRIAMHEGEKLTFPRSPSNVEQHLYSLACPLSLFVPETQRVMDGQTDRYCRLYGYIQYSLFTSWAPRVSVKWLAYLIPGLNLHLNTGNPIAV